MKSGEESYESEPRARKRSSGTGELASKVDEARESFQTLAADVSDRVERNPWRAVGVALGAGYILGGGLFSPLTGRLLWGGIRIGLRLAALPVVRDEVLGLFDAFSKGGRNDVS
jgi:hypothetical protein